MTDPEEFLIHTDQWVDVVENRDDYDYLFDLPTEMALDDLSTNDLVKISNGTERFFVRVTEIRKDCIIGTVDNHLRGRFDYVYGDRVRFEKRHVFTITKTKKNTRANRNTARMIKMLGIDPAKSSKEAMLFDTIQNK